MIGPHVFNYLQMWLESDNKHFVLCLHPYLALFPSPKIYLNTRCHIKQIYTHYICFFFLHLTSGYICLSLLISPTHTHTHTHTHKYHIVAWCFWLALLCSWCENTVSQVDRKCVCWWGGWSRRWLTEPLRIRSCYSVVKNTWGCLFYSLSFSPQMCFYPEHNSVFPLNWKSARKSCLHSAAPLLNV